MSVRLRGAICALTCAALVMGPFQATTGAAVPKIEYRCHKQTATNGWIYSGFDLKIVNKKTYKILDDDSTKTGKYRKGKGRKLFFTKGYLKKKGFKGKYYTMTAQGIAEVHLIKKSSKTGKPAHACAGEIP